MTVAVDLTGIATAITGGVFSLLGILATAWITSHMKDQAAAVTVNNAVKNSLGAIQQAATSEIQALRPQLPGVPEALAPGVQYVLDQAGPEMTRLGITPESVAKKVEAQIGLANVATNLAVSANATATVANPLDPTPPPLTAAGSGVI